MSQYLIWIVVMLRALVCQIVQDDQFATTFQKCGMWWVHRILQTGQKLQRSVVLHIRAEYSLFCFNVLHYKYHKNIKILYKKPRVAGLLVGVAWQARSPTSLVTWLIITTHYKQNYHNTYDALFIILPSFVHVHKLTFASLIEKST